MNLGFVMCARSRFKSAMSPGFRRSVDARRLVLPNDDCLFEPEQAAEFGKLIFGIGNFDGQISPDEYGLALDRLPQDFAGKTSALCDPVSVRYRAQSNNSGLLASWFLRPKIETDPLRGGDRLPLLSKMSSVCFGDVDASPEID
jgi:hypothetical protein